MYTHVLLVLRCGGDICYHALVMASADLLIRPSIHPEVSVDILLTVLLVVVIHTTHTLVLCICTPCYAYVPHRYTHAWCCVM